MPIVIDSESIIRVMSNTISQYTKYFGSLVGSEEVRRRCYREGHYHFIASHSIGHLSRAFILAHNELRKDFPCRALKFLDAGCGVGNIMLLAKSVHFNNGFDVYGIEFDPEIAEVAKKLTRHVNGRIHVGDISTYTKYHQYDLIFYYVPICNMEKMHKFANTLAKQMKLGAYVICTGSSSPFCISKSFKNAEIDSPLYKKVKGFKKVEFIK